MRRLFFVFLPLEMSSSYRFRKVKCRSCYEESIFGL